MSTPRHATEETRKISLEIATVLASRREIGKKPAIDLLDDIIARAEAIRDDAAKEIHDARCVKRMIKCETR